MKKNLVDTVKDKLSSKYRVSERSQKTIKSTDINVLLKRVKLNRKEEVRKKFYFSAAASTSLILFGLVIFS